jgi:hypothetical protein
MSKTLNGNLYHALVDRFGSVRISNQMEPMRARTAPNWTRQGKLDRVIDVWGESYCVDCPFCNDTRYRLWISHHWATRDRSTGSDNLWLATCFNEGCLITRDHQKQLHAMVFPDGKWADRVEVPEIRSVASPQAQAPVELPPMILVSELPSDHPASIYLHERGFDPVRLGAEYGAGFCPGCSTSRPRLAEPRIVVPVHALVSAAVASQSFKTKLVGWQARVVGSASRDTPKYLTSTGMPKSRLLYNLQNAIKADGPLVIVEGIFDAWAVGSNAVALFGKTLSDAQRQLIVRHARGRSVVVWLDSDAQDDAVKLAGQVRASLRSAQARNPVLVATCPPGVKDPGECPQSRVRPEQSGQVAGRAVVVRPRLVDVPTRRVHDRVLGLDAQQHREQVVRCREEERHPPSAAERQRLSCRPPTEEHPQRPRRKSFSIAGVASQLVC